MFWSLQIFRSERVLFPTFRNLAVLRASDYQPRTDHWRGRQVHEALCKRLQGLTPHQQALCQQVVFTQPVTFLIEYFSRRGKRLSFDRKVMAVMFNRYKTTKFQHPAAIPFVAKGVREALLQCQQQFQFDRSELRSCSLLIVRASILPR